MNATNCRGALAGFIRNAKQAFLLSNKHEEMIGEDVTKMKGYLTLERFSDLIDSSTNEEIFDTMRVFYNAVFKVGRPDTLLERDDWMDVGLTLGNVTIPVGKIYARALGVAREASEIYQDAQLTPEQDKECHLNDFIRMNLLRILYHSCQDDATIEKVGEVVNRSEELVGTTVRTHKKAVVQEQGGNGIAALFKTIAGALNKSGINLPVDDFDLKDQDINATISNIIGNSKVTDVLSKIKSISETAPDGKTAITNILQAVSVDGKDIAETLSSSAESIQAVFNKPAALADE